MDKPVIPSEVKESQDSFERGMASKLQSSQWLSIFQIFYGVILAG